MTKIDERKNIINSLKSNLGEPKKGIDKRIKYLKGIIILNLVFILFSDGIVVLSILAEILDYDFIRWQKTGLIVIISLSFTLKLPNYFYELKLLKHFKNINSKSEFKGNDKLNSDLKNIIDKSNNGFKNNWSVIILAIVILITGIWQMGYDVNSPYWNYMKLPILVFYGIVLNGFIITNKKLQHNIDETEKL